MTITRKTSMAPSYSYCKENKKSAWISPKKYLSPFVQQTTDNEYFKDTFHQILQMASLIGITCKPSYQRKNFFSVSYWDMVFLVLSSVTLTVSLPVIESFVNYWHVRSTYYLYFILGFTLRMMLLLKRQPVSASIVRLTNLCPRTKEKYSKSPKKQIIACYASIATTTIIVVSYFYKLASENLTDFQILGHRLTIYDNKYTILIVYICMTFTALNATVTIFVSLLICCNFYLAAEDVMKSYGDKLVQASRQCITNNVLLFHISSYRNMMNSFIQINSAISTCVLNIYAASIICFFHTIMVLVFFHEDVFYNSDFNLMAQFLVTLSMALITFFSLTFTGARANAAHGNLKVRNIDCLETVLGAGYIYDLELRMSFRMLFDVISSVWPNFTAGGMFTINESLILTAAGAMVTYGVLLFQWN